MGIEIIKNALLTVGVPVNHFFASKKPDKYIVYTEIGQGKMVYADNKSAMQTLKGTADYYTKTENDENFTKIQDAMNNAEGVSWSLSDIMYDTETNHIHYEWLWEVVSWKAKG